ncbi:hypothetical protein LSH36_164g11008 [Paralvinella palmiformis]|uniref:Uncharacterized protein n=1 Tax=Paralvinella palmiformis TaxID=53620 RepID=A0AAD9JTU8_9ANNE|nr:hypothetical protein LSH36_164g11008 [Paralvinella palmiformis]
MPKRRVKQQHHRYHPAGKDHKKQLKPDEEKGETGEQIVDMRKDIMKFFVGTASTDQHHDAQNEDSALYLAALAVLLEKGVEISQNARVRALAAAWARRDFELASGMLLNKDNFGLVEVLKAVTLLDCERQLRVEEKKLRILTSAGNKVRPHKIGKAKSNIDNLKALKPKDFPNLPWFLHYCFGAPAPEGTTVHYFATMTEQNVNELIHQHPVPFSHVKKLKDKLTDDSKQLIAECDKLDQVIWYYEDLQSSGVDEILQKRLSNGEMVTLSTGKLMERLLTIKMIREGIGQRGRCDQKGTENEHPTKAAFINRLIPQAQERLKSIRLTLDSPVVVMGDRSASMEVAIRTSTIIASLLTAVCHAKLVFFAEDNMDAPFVPSTVEEALEMAVTIKVSGCTKPAASLWPFYSSKEVLQTIIMVTDEEENSACQGMRFANMFQKYRQEVSPNCRLVFVSFLRRQHATGYMVQQLKECGIEEGIIQFKFDQSRPDLSKLDRMIGLLSAETDAFDVQVGKMKAEIVERGIANRLSELWAEPDRSRPESQTTNPDP